MERIYKAKISGAKLLMRNVQLADPINKYAKAMKQITSNRKKSDEDHEQIARIEFEGGLYFDPEIGPFVPDSWLAAMLVEGARKQKLGRVFEANVSLVAEKHSLQYKGPRTVDALWSEGFADRRGVVIGQAKTMRTRPLFRDWSVEFDVRLLECELNGGEIETAILNAGPYGIGDGRPMIAGKFGLDSFEEVTK